MLIFNVFICFYAFILFSMVEYIIEGKVSADLNEGCKCEKL